MLIVRLGKRGTGTAINVPKRFLAATGWKRGDYLIVEQRREGELTIRQALPINGKPGPDGTATPR